MTLREEIYDTLFCHLEPEGWNEYQIKKLTNSIIQLFGERIDSTLELRKEEPDKKISDFFKGYLEALQDVKEILK